MSKAEALRKARQLSANVICNFYAVEIDSADGRTHIVTDERYINSDEFFAVNGLVVASCYDGAVEWIN